MTYAPSGYKHGEIVDLLIHKRVYGKGSEFNKPVCGVPGDKPGWFAHSWKDVNCQDCLVIFVAKNMRSVVKICVDCLEKVRESVTTEGKVRCFDCYFKWKDDKKEKK